MLRLSILGLAIGLSVSLAADDAKLPADAVVRFGQPTEPDRGMAAIAISPDGKLLATGGYDRAIRVWERSSGKQLHHLPESSIVVSLAFSPDGKTLAGGRLWNVADGKPLPRWRPSDATVRTVAFSPDGKLLAVAYDDRVTQVLDAATGKERLRLPDDLDWITALAFSPDSKTLAAAGFGPEDFRLIDVGSGQELHRFPKHTDWVHGLAFSADGKRLVSASADRTVRLWDVASGAELGPTLKHEGSRLLSVALSADGRLAAAGTSDHAVILWEVLTGQPIRRFTGHAGDVRGVAFMPDEQQIASASTDGTALLWDLTGWNRGKPKELTAERMQQLWTNLAGTAEEAHTAKWQLIAVPAQSVPFLTEQLKPVDPGRIPKLVAQLDADGFDQREAAMDELEKLGAIAEPALRKALAAKPPLDMARRIEDLLKRASKNATDRLRVLRAMDALEKIGTPDAKKVLEGLAK